jgi:hypothetical protein
MEEIVRGLIRSVSIESTSCQRMPATSGESNFAIAESEFNPQCQLTDTVSAGVTEASGKNLSE